MELRTLVLVALGVVLLAWVVFCGVQYVRTTRRAVSQLRVPAHMVCDGCGYHFDVDISDVVKTAFSRSRSVTRTKRVGAALVDEPEYTRFAKRVFCPHCGRQVWANVENINELNELSRRTVVRSGLRWLVAMLVGGLLVFALGAVAIGFVNRAADQRTDELQQQLEESFNERYGIN